MKNYQMILASLLLGSFATPVEAAKDDPNCKTVNLTNTGYYQLNTHYTPCTGAATTNHLDISQSDEIYVKKDDTITLEAAGAGHPIENVKKGVKITENKDITCSGATLWQASCDVEKATAASKAPKMKK